MEINFNFTLFFTAFGLACFLEALPYLLAPKKVREALSFLLEQDDEVIRMYGICVLLFGLLIMWLAL